MLDQNAHTVQRSNRFCRFLFVFLLWFLSFLVTHLFLFLPFFCYQVPSGFCLFLVLLIQFLFFFFMFIRFYFFIIFIFLNLFFFSFLICYFFLIQQGYESKYIQAICSILSIFSIKQKCISFLHFSTPNQTPWEKNFNISSSPHFSIPSPFSILPLFQTLHTNQTDPYNLFEWREKMEWKEMKIIIRIFFHSIVWEF